MKKSLVYVGCLLAIHVATCTGMNSNTDMEEKYEIVASEFLTTARQTYKFSEEAIYTEIQKEVEKAHELFKGYAIQSPIAETLASFFSKLVNYLQKNQFILFTNAQRPYHPVPIDSETFLQGCVRMNLALKILAKLNITQPQVLKSVDINRPVVLLKKSHEPVV